MKNHPLGPYHGKKVAILGCSVEGIDSAKYFTSHGALVTCCDKRSKEELGETFTLLKGLGVNFQLGKNYLENLSHFDFLVRSPGMSPYRAEIKKAQQAGTILTSLTKVFFDQCPAPIIGVSGTKGKGTTSTLIYSILARAGKTVFLGGNVGVPLLSTVDSIPKSAWVVLELSSFQLQDLRKSPHIAVVLAITQEHLANHDPLASNFHISREEYVHAKQSLVAFQTDSDIVIANADNGTSDEFALLSKGQKYRFSKDKTDVDAYVPGEDVYINTNGTKKLVISKDEIQLRGAHNLENIAAATLAAMAVGVQLKTIQEAIRLFEPLPHRLNIVRTYNGITYVDDSFSTVPETAIAALHAFSEPVVLIAGGSEKGSDFSDLGIAIVKKKLRGLILIGDMASKIENAVLTAAPNAQVPPIIRNCRNMDEIIEAATSLAKPGDVVLLSPACASFGMFKNYKERGNLFRSSVQAL